MKKLDDVLKIFFEDLKPEVQEELLNFLSVDNAEEVSLDSVPIYTAYRETE